MATHDRLFDLVPPPQPTDILDTFNALGGPKVRVTPTASGYGVVLEENGLSEGGSGILIAKDLTSSDALALATVWRDRIESAK